MRYNGQNSNGSRLWSTLYKRDMLPGMKFGGLKGLRPLSGQLDDYTERNIVDDSGTKYINMVWI